MNPPSSPALKGNKLPLWLAVGHFILRAPARLARTPLPAFLARLAAQPRRGAGFGEVHCLSRIWLRLPGLRSADTCYLRSLVLFRFIDPGDGDLCLHFGIDEPRPGERLHGHAWVSLRGKPLNPPPSMPESRFREIYRYSILTGGSSASGATFAAAMISGSPTAPAPSPPSPATQASAPTGADRAG